MRYFYFESSHLNCKISYGVRESNGAYVEGLHSGGDFSSSSTLDDWLELFSDIVTECTKEEAEEIYLKRALEKL